MDKFGWQRPEMEVGMTGIQKACMLKKMQRYSKKVDMIAKGNMLAASRERMMKDIRDM